LKWAPDEAIDLPKTVHDAKASIFPSDVDALDLM
jgi:hypothetical protein